MTIETPMFQGEPKPGKVQAIAILTLISGISNILWPLVLYAIIGTATLFVGCLALPLFLPPIVLGVFEIVYAAKLLPTPIKPAKPSPAIAGFEIACILTGNLLAAAAGIVALIFYAEPEVKAYFAKFAPGQSMPEPEAAPVVPPAPATVEPVVAPVPAEPIPPAAVEETIVPAAVEPAATVVAMQPVTLPVAEPAPAAPEPVKAAQPKTVKAKPSAKAAAPSSPKGKKTAAKPAAKAKTVKPAPSASKPAAKKTGK